MNFWHVCLKKPSPLRSLFHQGMENDSGQCLDKMWDSPRDRLKKRMASIDAAEGEISWLLVPRISHAGSYTSIVPLESPQTKFVMQSKFC